VWRRIHASRGQPTEVVSLDPHRSRGARSGHRDEALALARELEPLARRPPSPWFDLQILYARLFLATDDEAGPAFEDALGRDLSAWPVVQARIKLAYGEWLRRHRRQVESRAPLRAAREAFDALGMNLWAERARQELRAAGESSQRRERDSLDDLTPQELQIVQMVAQGLSNRVIAERLYLSRRTVESHLYRVFPKLGVSSRAQLVSVLGPRLGTAS
jgi:DNA-binding CsgD family transcriptional regulator